MPDRAATQPADKTFDAAVRSYERRAGGKIPALMAHKKGIAELRGKQASFRTISNLLKQAGVESLTIRSPAFATRFLSRRRSAASRQGRRLHRQRQMSSAS